jgi:membrane-bound inhibitor of C-type lysozyme
MDRVVGIAAVLLACLVAAACASREHDEASFRRRVIELDLQSGQLPATTPVAYRCESREVQPLTLTVAFHAQTEPPSAVLSSGERGVVALVARSASGARYVAPDLEFWEHQGEATLRWSGRTWRCRRG